MNIERMVRIIAGSFVLVSVALSWLVSPKFLYATVFVGLNLFQSGFTGFCPLANILKKFGMTEGASQCG